MIKGRISWILSPMQKSTFNNAVFIALVLFVLSFAIRLLYYHSHSDLTTIGSIVGVPFSDARYWNEGAIAISQGKGIIGSYRPFYSIFLAIFYIWFGPSFFLAKILNIIANSLTVSFIYLTGEKVSNKLIGLAAAMVAMLNTHYLTTNLTVMTESLGLFLFVLSCYLLILGLERKSYSLLLFAGIVFSLCNLTRTMTLIAFPGCVIIIFYILKKQNISYRKNILLLSLFSFGVLITLAPWLIRQKAVYGVFSIAPNSADALYAATSPKYQQWTGAVALEVLEKRLFTPKEQHDFFLRGAMKNISQYPLFYLKNCLKSTYEFMSFYKCQLSPIPQKYELILCFVGIILLFILKNNYALILINSLVFVAIGSGMVANSGAPHRLFTMVSWIFDFFYIFTLAYMVCFVYSKFILRKHEPYLKRLISKEDPIIDRSFYDKGRLKKYSKYFSLLLLFFFIISSIRIIYSNFSKTQSIEKVPSLNFQEKMKILAEINSIRPATFDHIGLNKDTFADPENPYVNDPNDYKDHGKIIVNLSKIDKYLYYIPKEKRIDDLFRLFAYRNYDRSIFSMGNWGWVFYIFPGKIPDQLKEKYVISVGKLSVDMKSIFEARRIVELIAIIPYEEGIDLKKILFASNEDHWNILDHLRN